VIWEISSCPNDWTRWHEEPFPSSLKTKKFGFKGLAITGARTTFRAITYQHLALETFWWKASRSYTHTRYAVA
jgi:hypothetical protein